MRKTVIMKENNLLSDWRPSIFNFERQLGRTLRSGSSPSTSPSAGDSSGRHWQILEAMRIVERGQSRVSI